MIDRARTKKKGLDPKRNEKLQVRFGGDSRGLLVQILPALFSMIPLFTVFH